MFKKIIRWFYKINKLKCPDCGCRQTTEEVIDRIDYTVCEVRIRCEQCNRIVNHWAYGYMQSPETYTEAFSDRVKYCIRVLLTKWHLRQKRGKKKVK